MNKAAAFVSQRHGGSSASLILVLSHSHDDDDDEQKKTKQACDRHAPQHAPDGVPAQRVADDQRGFERAKVSTGKESGKRSSEERAQHCWTTAPPKFILAVSNTWLRNETKYNTARRLPSRLTLRATRDSAARPFRSSGSSTESLPAPRVGAPTRSLRETLSRESLTA